MRNLISADGSSQIARSYYQAMVCSDPSSPKSNGSAFLLDEGVITFALNHYDKCCGIDSSLPLVYSCAFSFCYFRVSLGRSTSFFVIERNVRKDGFKSGTNTHPMVDLCSDN